MFCARRADIEGFGRHLERCGRARATVARRLCTIACFYRYAEEEGRIPTSPAVHVRRPRLDYESHATGLDRNEVGALLVAAGLGGPQEHALISLLALNGLRVSEAIGANIEQLGLERGHRTLTILRKGGKIVTIPLAPRTARAVTWPSVNAATDRSSKPTAAPGWTVMRPLEPCGASPDVPALRRRSDLTPFGTHSSPPRSTPASRSAMCKKRPVTPTRAPRCATTAPASASTATARTSSPPSSPERLDRDDGASWERAISRQSEACLLSRGSFEPCSDARGRARDVAGLVGRSVLLGFGQWLVPKCRVQGSAGHAGLKSRP